MTRLLAVRDVSREPGLSADLFADIEACRDWRARATGLVDGLFAERAPAGRETGRADGR